MKPLLLVLLVLQHVMCSERLAPWFVWEPGSVVQYAARAGVVVRCAARGRPPPTLAWLDADGAPLTDLPSVRRVYENGTLEVFGVGVGDAVSGAVVRCRAHNVHGAALSRDVRLEPVAAERWEPTVSAAPVAPGAVAALPCRATGPGAPTPTLVRPTLWYKDDRVIQPETPSPEARVLSAGDVLLVGETRVTDAGRYTCVARHALTQSTKRATPPATLTLTSRPTSSAPRLVTARAGEEVTVPAGTDFCMPCVSSEHPPPQYTWYREWEGRLQPVEAAEGVWLWRGGAALCVRRARTALSGAWLCKAYNVYGEATARLRVTVVDVLSVSVSPAVVVAPAGATVRLTCTASDAAATLAWLHDAAPAPGTAELVLRSLGRHHRGIYQCFARRGTDSAQASAEVRLGDSPPELQYTFIEQALRGGGEVSLRCAASGAPPPRFLWLLDGAPLEAGGRLAFAEHAVPPADVLALLNITAAVVADGGRYTCRAHNRLGHAEHSARLNIYGPPSVRALGPVRVVAGANATIYCPYAGYPISSISWWRRGASAAVGGGGGRVAARGAELRLAPALAQDAGSYACTVTAPGGATATQDIEIQVRNPPKISPFMFSTELTEGSSVQVLCGVSSGDKPMYFSWLKDGEPLPPNLQIEEKNLNEFSLLMFSELSARHSGEYTCRVSNHAATVNYTATLTVKVAPVWVTEPLDAAVLLGAPILLECAAKGYPPPTIMWHRKIEKDGENIGGESEHWERVGGGWEGDATEGLRARGGALAARAAARAHHALYRCTADNGVGPPLIKLVNLTVHEPAHFEDTGGNVSCVRGHSAALMCHALGDAPLVVHWSHAATGTDIDLKSYRWSVSEVRTEAGLRSTLRVRAAEKADAGVYRCHAHNHYGTSEILLYLHVEEPPAAPRGVRLAGVGGRWVRVTWHAGSPGRLAYSARLTPLHALPAPSPPTPLHYNLTLEPVSSDADELNALASRVEGLRPAAAYSLRVAAANHVGHSPHSDPLVFTTLEEAPAAPPQNVRVRSGNPGELHLSWSAPSQDSWNGEVLGYVATWREMGRMSAGDGEGEGVGEGGRATSPGWSSAELLVSGLRGGSRYGLTLRAYNRAGAGPPAPLLYATTAEGVPENAPASVSCEPLSPRTMRVRWSPTRRTPAAALRGYDLHYAPVRIKPEGGGGGGGGGGGEGEGSGRAVRAGAGAGQATLQALLPRTNYSVWVRARSDAGRGPPAPPVYCATHEDVPGVVETMSAMAAGEDAVRVTWLPPPGRAARLTHYTLYTRELGKHGGEWSQRVEAREGEGEGEGEVWREVRGLRPAVYEVWVRAHAAAGAGPTSRVLTAAPAQPVSARISSVGRVTYVAAGSTVRLRCSAVGAPPLSRRWAPLPRRHTLTDFGDLIIHEVDSECSGKYTCSVRNVGGADVAVTTVVVVSAPSAPAAPRLLRTEPRALHVAWDAPAPSTPPAIAAPTLGYTVSWSREGGEGGEEGEEGEVRLPAADTTLVVRRLACGAPYLVTVRADNAVGTSPPSRALLATTEGDKTVAAPGKEFVWANTSTLRLNLLAWRARCEVSAWHVALRRADTADTATWRHLPTDGETAEANDLSPGTWYEVKVVASSPGGETAAVYRAATLSARGERLGDAVEVPGEGRAGAGAAGGGAGGGARGPLLAAAAALAAAALGAAVWLRGRGRGREAALPPPPHPQLYTTEPGKRNGNGKTLTPPAPHPHDVLYEISPYATCSMSGGSGGRGGGALHLHTFARAEALELGAPPPRPNLLAHHAPEYGRCGDSESESSGGGSPCAACARAAATAAGPYRLPPAAPAPPPSGAGPRPGVIATATATATAVTRRRRDRHPPTATATGRSTTAGGGATGATTGAT